jgi:hypothetical protein
MWSPGITVTKEYLATLYVQKSQKNERKSRTVHSLVPRPHPYEDMEKGLVIFGRLLWFGRLWARAPTRVHLNKARI